MSERSDPVVKPSFRRATDGDVDTVVEMMRDYYDDEGYPFDAVATRDAAQRLCESAELGALWMIDVSDEPVGYLVVTFGFSMEYRGRDAFIDDLYLRPDARGQGIGTQAIATAEAFCRAHDVHALHLEVEGEKLGARRLYERSGFVANDRALMTKRLDATKEKEGG